jgi:4-alpha-glucanotransferase
MPKSELKRRSGVLVPLFSVYSEKSHGVGDLGDLKLLVDWCGKTGNSILQLLPMNEAGPTFCPYDSISSFALEPMYISLNSLKGNLHKKIKGKINDSRRVDYRVKKEKCDILWEIFKKEDDFASDIGFQKFIKESSYWLDDFSAYKALKSYHAGAPWYEWGEAYKNRDSRMLEEFVKEHTDELNFYKWVQWRLFEQFKEVKEYAGSKKILLKGDLPLLVSRDSADVWAPALRQTCIARKGSAGGCRLIIGRISARMVLGI